MQYVTAMEAYALRKTVALCACLVVSMLCELCADREEQTGVFMPGFAYYSLLLDLSSLCSH